MEVGYIEALICSYHIPNCIGANIVSGTAVRGAGEARQHTSSKRPLLHLGLFIHLFY